MTKMLPGRPKLTLHPTDLLTAPPQSQSCSTLTIPWVYSMIDDIKCDNQSNGTMGQLIPIEEHSTTEHDQTGENDRILLLFFDIPPKTLRQIHHHHCIAVLMHDERSERIKRKHGETMTKMEKKTAHDSHLRTPTPTQQFRTCFSTNIQAISTQELRIYPSL